jgi:signal peptide peptidase SppA
MSKMHVRSTAMNVLSQMNHSPVLLEPRFLASLSDHFLAMNSCDDDDYEAKAELAMRQNLCETYGLGPASADKPFAFANGTAVIPVHGSLINRYSGYYYGYVTGYNFIRRQAALASMDDDVERIIFDVNSNGGQAAGCFELSAELAAIEKPTLAVVDSNCYSAAYALSSAADQIAVTPSGGAGSIGVISMHIDISKALEDYGIKITLITAGAHKADGHPFAELPEEVRKDIQADIDQAYDQFVSLVATNRGLDEKSVRATEARCYSAQDALGLGLIDIVATPNQAATTFINGPSGSDNDDIEDDEMPGENKTTTKPDNSQANAGVTDQELNAARNDGAKAEQTRIAGILGCEAAKDRPALANHIAFSTSMSVEDANTMLNAAGKETSAAAPAATTTTTPEAAKTNFEKAMDSGEHPNVGANGGGEEKQAEEGDLEANLSSFGFKFN